MGSRLRGSGALRGWYDSGIALDRVEDGGPVKLHVEHRGAEGCLPFTLRMQKSGTLDNTGEAIWFEECGDSRQESLEEKIIELKASHPNVSGKVAMLMLRDAGVKFQASAFWKAWT